MSPQTLRSGESRDCSRGNQLPGSGRRIGKSMKGEDFQQLLLGRISDKFCPGAVVVMAHL